MAAAITQLTTALPALDTGEAKAALEAAVPIPVRGAARFLEELAAHVASHPDALTSGDTRCPPVLLRLPTSCTTPGTPWSGPGASGSVTRWPGPAT